MFQLWLAAFVVLLSAYVREVSSTCSEYEHYTTEQVKAACWVANWKAGTCEQTTDYSLCKKLAQASYDDEYVCCNAIAQTGRWNGGSSPLGVCAELKAGECQPNGNEGTWTCIDNRPNGDKCWFPDYKQQTCAEHKDASFCTKGGRTVYKTPQYCCDMLSWGGIWHGKSEAKGVCKEFCSTKTDTFACWSGLTATVAVKKPSAGHPSSGSCTCHQAQRGETWSTVAADYGTTPYTIFESNSQADKHGSPNVGKWYRICPAPGPEAVRFRSSGKEDTFTGCLDGSYPRPCSGYSGQAQKDCFCSYRDDGQYQWPFDGEDCRKYIKCKNGESVAVETCDDGEVVHEEPQEDGSVWAKCVKTPDGFKCAAGCSDHSCVCRDLLLPTGTYQNPFDWDERSGINCNYKDGSPQWFDGVAICPLGKYDAEKKECRSELSKTCERKTSYAGCQAFYPPPDTGCPEKRKLLAASLSWGTATDRTCNWWIGRPCVCPARNRGWSTNFGCAFNSCAAKSRNPCRNGGGYSKQPATRTKDVCFCEFNGGCPYMFYRKCAFRW